MSLAGKELAVEVQFVEDVDLPGRPLGLNPSGQALIIEGVEYPPVAPGTVLGADDKALDFGFGTTARSREGEDAEQ